MSDIEREAFENAMKAIHPKAYLKRAPSGQYKRSDIEIKWRGFCLGMEAQKIKSARQAPGSGEVEPVVWLVKFKEYEGRFEFAEPYEKATNPEYWTDAFPVYTHPPAKVPEKIEIDKFDATKKKIWERGWNAAIDAMLTTPTPVTTPETEWVKLPHDVVINGGMTFRKGVRLSTFIKAAERWHREAMKQYAGISKEDIQALLNQPPTAQDGE